MSVSRTDATILVAVDGSPESDLAVAWATRESVLRDAPVTLMHVISPDLMNVPLLPTFNTPEWYENSACHILRHAERDYRAESTGVVQTDPHLVVDHGSIVASLANASKDAQLIVVGNRRLGAFRRLVGGSVSTGLLRHAHCPVAVVNGVTAAGRASDAPVVLGVDGSDASDAATALAFDEAFRRQVDLVAVHAWSDAGVDADFGSDWHVYHTLADEALSARMAKWQERYPNVPVRRRIVCNEPAYWLVQESQRAQLVVLGSRGRGGFTGMLLGSTSSAVVQAAPVTVVVARTRVR
jgi:nucleotide-binding universal stress UspA family protein